MKKIIALLLSLTMVLSMAACGSSDSASAASQKEAASAAASGGETAGSETAAIPGLEDGVFTIPTTATALFPSRTPTSMPTATTL